MSKMVLMLEDDVTSALYRENMEAAGYDVYHATNFSAAWEWTEIDPGIEAFDFLIVDLAIVPMTMNQKMLFTAEENAEMERLNERTGCSLNGWIWLKKIIRERAFKGKAIVISAFMEALPDDEKGNYKPVVFIDKTEPNALLKLFSELKG